MFFNIHARLKTVKCYRSSVLSNNAEMALSWLSRQKEAVTLNFTSVRNSLLHSGLCIFVIVITKVIS